MLIVLWCLFVLLIQALWLLSSLELLCSYLTALETLSHRNLKRVDEWQTSMFIYIKVVS